MINIKYLIKKYDAADIEAAFVKSFIRKLNINVRKNELIKSFIAISNPTIDVIEEQIDIIYSNISIYDLIEVFELLIPQEDKKLNGAFFTPRVITKYIVEETLRTGNEVICDPSCGCGAFLIESAIYLSKISNNKYFDVIERNIHGADIAEYSIKRAKILLSLLCLMNGEDKRSISFNIFQTDSLKFDWESYLRKANKGMKFDAIIGNPPYVKFQDLPNELRKSLYDNWQTLKSGTYNLYFAFFELGMKILKENGDLGYITPNNYFTSLSGINLRRFLSGNKYLLKLLDFNHLKVFEAQTYTCISFLSKKENKYFLYEKIKDKRMLENLNKLSFSKISFDELNDNKWRLLKLKDKVNIKSIENCPTKLGDLVDIKVGIATCKDTLYFIDGDSLLNGYYKKYYQGKEYLIEKDCTKPIIRISDVEGQDEMKLYNKMIIYPYCINANNKAEIIPESKLKMMYPKCYEYLLSIKEELQKRDKGLQKYPAWYAYARSQGISLNGEKLLTPTFSAKPRFIFDGNQERLFCNGYAIFTKNNMRLFGTNKLSLKVLSKVLNSKIMDYYITNTSVSIEGGYPCYQKNFIELFGIPDLSDKDITYLSVENSSNKIDAFLSDKYGVEIK